MAKGKIPSQSRAITTKNNIINVAFKSFLKRGYKKTNTIQIAKEAKVSIGIIYSYFEDKDELLLLWLNSLLERLDDYFYNQFKLREYDVELSFIISNIIEKTIEGFFSSPISKENDPVLNKYLSAFYEKAEKIFIKTCSEANIFIRYPQETTHIILKLIQTYYDDVSSLENNLNTDTLKNQYVKAIASLLEK